MIGEPGGVSPRTSLHFTLSKANSLLKKSWSTILSYSFTEEFGHVGNVLHVFQQAANTARLA